MNNNILGNRIKETLEKKNKTQSDLCRETGIKRSTISAIITGVRDNPNIDLLVSIAKALDVSIDYLVGLSDESSIDVCLKDISKKTGISTMALKNLDESISDYRRVGNTKPIKGDLINTLNIILESDYLAPFLDECSMYFRYFPRYGGMAYVFNTERRDAANDDFFSKDNNGEYHFDATIKNIYENPNTTLMTPLDYDEYLLDIAKSCIKGIKKYSYDFYKSNIKELKEVEKIRIDWQKELTNDKSLYPKKRIKLKLNVLDNHIRKLKYNILFYETKKSYENNEDE